MVPETALWAGGCHLPSFIGQESAAQRGSGTCLRSQSQAAWLRAQALSPDLCCYLQARPRVSGARTVELALPGDQRQNCPSRCDLTRLNQAGGARFLGLSLLTKKNVCGKNANSKEQSFTVWDSQNQRMSGSKMKYVHLMGAPVFLRRIMSDSIFYSVFLKNVFIHLFLAELGLRCCAGFLQFRGHRLLLLWRTASVARGLRSHGTHA